MLVPNSFVSPQKYTRTRKSYFNISHLLEVWNMGVILMEHLYEGNKSMVIFIAVLSEVQNKLSTITM